MSIGLILSQHHQKLLLSNMKIMSIRAGDYAKGLVRQFPNINSTQSWLKTPEAYCLKKNNYTGDWSLCKCESLRKSRKVNNNWFHPLSYNNSRESWGEATVMIWSWAYPPILGCNWVGVYGHGSMLNFLNSKEELYYIKAEYTIKLQTSLREYSHTTSNLNSKTV
jgi:hypothetical protein